MRFLILLSTYNGELYLREQIDSILKQQGVEVDILVRDDGSRDLTSAIIQEYVTATSGRITFMQGKNVGAAKSFIELVQMAKNRVYDYYAFSDQDDVWLSDKLSSAVNMCWNVEKQKVPTLYFGQYQMVNGQLNYIRTTFQHPKISFGHALVDNCATGCTMVFNRALLLCLCKYTPNYILMHDDWIYKVCLGIGGIVYYDFSPHILYRQHGANVIGGVNDGFVKKWKIRLRKFLFYGTHIRLHIAEELLNGYQKELTEENRILLYRIVKYQKGLNRFRLLFDKRLCGQTWEHSLRIKFLILSSKY